MYYWKNNPCSVFMKDAREGPCISGDKTGLHTVREGLPRTLPSCFFHPGCPIWTLRPHKLYPDPRFATGCSPWQENRVPSHTAVSSGSFAVLGSLYA